MTSESFSQAAYVNFFNGKPYGYFGITPSLVEDDMSVPFNNIIIIAMGCDRLKHTTTAEAIILKGAKAYIGWNRPVAAGHIDNATTHLLRYLVTEKQTIQESLSNTMKKVDPDPIDQSILTFYPEAAASHTIPDNTNHEALHGAEILLNTQKQTSRPHHKELSDEQEARNGSNKILLMSHSSYRLKG